MATPADKKMINNINDNAMLADIQRGDVARQARTVAKQPYWDTDVKSAGLFPAYFGRIGNALGVNPEAVRRNQNAAISARNVVNTKTQEPMLGSRQAPVANPQVVSAKGKPAPLLKTVTPPAPQPVAEPDISTEVDKLRKPIDLPKVAKDPTADIPALPTYDSQPYSERQEYAVNTAVNKAQAANQDNAFDANNVLASAARNLTGWSALALPGFVQNAQSQIQDVNKNTANIEMTALPSRLKAIESGEELQKYQQKAAIEDRQKLIQALENPLFAENKELLKSQIEKEGADTGYKNIQARAAMIKALSSNEGEASLGDIARSAEAQYKIIEGMSIPEEQKQQMRAQVVQDLATRSQGLKIKGGALNTNGVD